MSSHPLGSRGARLAGLLLACGTATGCAAGAAGPGAVAQATAVVSAAVASDELLVKAVASDGPGCSAAVAEHGEVVWAAARGLADVEQARPMTTATEFDLASVSKQFTATAVLLLAQQGALHLDDPLARHLSGLPRWAEVVTLGHLLRHTAGVPDYTTLLADRGTTAADAASQQDALAAIASVSSLDAPGTEFRYSNSHYVLLAEVVRTASGVALPEFLAERVFGPLDLAMTMEPGSTSPDVATPYARASGRWRATPSRWTQLGDGSVHTTPSELARWGEQYRTARVGGKAWLDAVTAGAVPTGRPDGARYGAGIEIAQDGALSHLGGWSGYVTAFGVTADRSTSIALSCNSADVAVDTVAVGLLRIWAKSTTPTQGSR